MTVLMCVCVSFLGVWEGLLGTKIRLRLSVSEPILVLQMVFSGPAALHNEPHWKSLFQGSQFLGL